MYIRTLACQEKSPRKRSVLRIRCSGFSAHPLGAAESDGPWSPRHRTFGKPFGKPFGDGESSRHGGARGRRPPDRRVPPFTRFRKDGVTLTRSPDASTAEHTTMARRHVAAVGVRPAGAPVRNPAEVSETCLIVGVTSRITAVLLSKAGPTLGGRGYSRPLTDRIVPNMANGCAWSKIPGGPPEEHDA